MDVSAAADRRSGHRDQSRAGGTRAVLLSRLPEALVPARCRADAHRQGGGSRAAALSVGFQPLARGSRWLDACCVAVLAFDTVAINRANAAAVEPIDMRWIEPIKARAQSTFAVSWIPSSVSAFTQSWVVGVSLSLTSTFLDRLSTGRHPFETRGDLFLFGERDGEQKLNSYLHPDFWRALLSERSDVALRPGRASLTSRLPDDRASEAASFRSLSRPQLQLERVIPFQVRAGEAVALGGSRRHPLAPRRARRARPRWSDRRWRHGQGPGAVAEIRRRVETCVAGLQLQPLEGERPCTAWHRKAPQSAGLKVLFIVSRCATVVVS